MDSGTKTLLSCVVFMYKLSRAYLHAQKWPMIWRRGKRRRRISKKHTYKTKYCYCYPLITSLINWFFTAWLVSCLGVWLNVVLINKVSWHNRKSNECDLWPRIEILIDWLIYWMVSCLFRWFVDWQIC